MGESEEFHNSLIIRVNQCSSVVPILFLGLTSQSKIQQQHPNQRSGNPPGPDCLRNSPGVIPIFFLNKRLMYSGC